MLLPVGLAALLRLRAEPLRTVVSGAAGAGACAAVTFAVLNPYLIIRFGEFRDKVQAQAEVAGNLAKAGQEGSAPAYYLDSLTWGLGWLVALAAHGGRGRAGPPRLAPGAAAGRLPGRAVLPT